MGAVFGPEFEVTTAKEKINHKEHREHKEKLDCQSHEQGI